MKIKPSKNKVLYIFYICFALIFIFIGSAVVLTTSNNLQPAFSQGYIPPPPLTTSTNQNDQIANNNNNNNPSTSNTIGSSSSGQSQLNQGQQQQPDNSNCNTKLMIGCGSISPNNSTTSTTTTPTSQQEQPDNSNCNTKLMIGCGSISPSKTSSTPNQSTQDNTPDTTNAGGSTGSNSFSPNQPFTTQNPNTNLGGGSTDQLANPTAFNYQINPEKRFVDISKDPTQKINSLVTNSFGQGVPNVPVSIQVKDPTGKTAALFTGKTDNDGKNVVSFPVKTTGTWTAIVAISSSPAAGGPFGDQITWNAVSRSIPNLVCSTGPHPNCHVE